MSDKSIIRATQQCDRCRGRTLIYHRGAGTGDDPSEWITCPDCGGTGVVRVDEFGQVSKIFTRNPIETEVDDAPF